MYKFNAIDCISELFQLGESFVSSKWSFDQIGDADRKDNIENDTQEENSASENGEKGNTCSSDDASSSVTITSPRVTDEPLVVTGEPNKPLIGITKIRKLKFLK